MYDTFNANKQTNMPIIENLKTMYIFSYNLFENTVFIRFFPVNFVDTVLGIMLQMLMCQNFKIGVYILPRQIVSWLSRMSWLKVPSSMRQWNHHSQLGGCQWWMHQEVGVGCWESGWDWYKGRGWQVSLVTTMSYLTIPFIIWCHFLDITSSWLCNKFRL